VVVSVWRKESVVKRGKTLPTRTTFSVWCIITTPWYRQLRKNYKKRYNQNFNNKKSVTIVGFIVVYDLRILNCVAKKFISVLVCDLNDLLKSFRHSYSHIAKAIAKVNRQLIIAYNIYSALPKRCCQIANFNESQ